MKITNKDRFLNYLNSLRFLGVGSQGACYYDPKTNQVLKVFHIFFDDDYDDVISEDLTQFSNITNSTFIWPIETIEYKSFVIGYTMKFVKSKSLYEINPFKANILKEAAESTHTFKAQNHRYLFDAVRGMQQQPFRFGHHSFLYNLQRGRHTVGGK